jgi:hypothetical protein
VSGKITAYSVARYRAEAAEQRRRGLKVGGTVTVFCVSDGTRTRYIDAYGHAPSTRKAAAIEAFKRGEGREHEHR